MTTTAKLNATDLHWLSSPATFDFTISYRAGKINGDADGLSCLPHNDPPDTEATQKEEYLKPFLARLMPPPDTFSPDAIHTPVIEAMCLNTDAVPWIDTVPVPDHGHLTSSPAPDWRRHQHEDCTIGQVFQILRMERKHISNPNQQSQLPQDVACLLREKTASLSKMVLRYGSVKWTAKKDCS